MTKKSKTNMHPSWLRAFEEAFLAFLKYSHRHTEALVMVVEIREEDQRGQIKVVGRDNVLDAAQAISAVEEALSATVIAYALRGRTRVEPQLLEYPQIRKLVEKHADVAA